MKKTIKQLFFFSMLVALFASCKKDENKVLFEGGTDPVLSATTLASPIAFQLANQNDPAIKFTWTNPDYKLNTGISSQNVTYTLQLDTVGANFTNPKIAEYSIANDLTKSFTVGMLNDAMVSATKLGLKDGVAHDMEVRVKSNMSNGTVPLYSNVIQLLAITPYPDPNVPRLWITGSACNSNWTNSPPDEQQFEYLGELKFQLFITFAPGGQYKFLTKKGFWQPQWGGCSPTGGTLHVNPGGGTDPAEINTPALPGLYKINVDLKATDPKCTIVLQ